MQLTATRQSLTTTPATPVFDIARLEVGNEFKKLADVVDGRLHLGDWPAFDAQGYPTRIDDEVYCTR